MKRLDLIKLERETEKAINVTVTYNGLSITLWLPKSSASIVNNEVLVMSRFWMYKEIEILKDIRNTGSVRLIGKIKEYDKSFGVHVRIYECLSEQSISRIMFFPKSQVTEVTDSSFVVPSWLFSKKEEEIKEENSNRTFKSSTFEVEVNKEYL